MRESVSFPRPQFKVDVVQNASSLSRIYEHFPNLANNHDLYLSMMGKQAISVERFLEIVKHNQK